MERVTDDQLRQRDAPGTDEGRTDGAEMDSRQVGAVFLYCLFVMPYTIWLPSAI